MRIVTFELTDLTRIIDLVHHPLCVVLQIGLIVCVLNIVSITGGTALPDWLSLQSSCEYFLGSHFEWIWLHISVVRLVLCGCVTRAVSLDHHSL